MPPPPQHPITTRHVNNANNLDLFSLLLFLFPAKAPIFPYFPFYPRRFHKIPTMSHNRRFATPQSLSDWLRPRLRSDSLASWGVKPGTKNVHNLWLELAEGESSLLDSSPPIRTVHVVTVKVVDPTRTRVLIESQQLLSDGSFRTRGRPLSEKMKPHEDPISAANRAVREELGSILNGSGRVEIVPGSYRKEVEERSSASYPGLPACYELHSVEATVEGLPEEEEFITEEEHEYDVVSGEARVASEAAVSVKKHFWKWVSLNSLSN